MQYLMAARILKHFIYIFIFDRYHVPENEIYVKNLLIGGFLIMKKMKIVSLILASTIGMSSAYAIPKMTCSCTSGSMIIEFTKTGFKRSCTDGGRVSCVLD